MEISNLEFNITSTLSDTIFKLSTKYFSSVNEDYDTEMTFNILILLFKFYDNFLDINCIIKQVFNHNILFDLCLLKYIYDNFQSNKFF